MRHDSFLRRLDKKANNTIRDGEGGLGNARGVVKANRALSKAIIENALDEIAQDEEEKLDECIMCGRACVKAVCSEKCKANGVEAGLIRE